MVRVEAMTRGQALYRAMCDSVGLDPDTNGTQREVHVICDDILAQSELSKLKNGKRQPRDSKVRALEQRFGFRLTYSWERADDAD